MRRNDHVSFKILQSAGYGFLPGRRSRNPGNVTGGSLRQLQRMSSMEAYDSPRISYNVSQEPWNSFHGFARNSIVG